MDSEIVYNYCQVKLRHFFSMIFHHNAYFLQDVSKGIMYPERKQKELLHGG